MKTISLLLSVAICAGACRTPSEPEPVVLREPALRFVGCDVSTVWMFIIDGNDYPQRGTNWFIPAHATLIVPATEGAHHVVLLRWMPTILAVRDSAFTSKPYDLPCP